MIRECVNILLNVVLWRSTERMVLHRVEHNVVFYQFINLEITMDIDHLREMGAPAYI